MVANIRNGIYQLKQLSRLSGYRLANKELGNIDNSFFPSSVYLGNYSVSDIFESRKYAINFADLWLKNAIGDSFAKSARAANANSLHRLELIAATESSKAYNEGRTIAALNYDGSLELFKVWDSTLDNHSCHQCSSNDGEMVEIGEKFSFGEPGEVHPNCQCTYNILSANELTT